jgi:cell division protein FtsB
VRTGIAGLVILLVLLQYRLWFADGGLVKVHRLEARIQQQQARNERLRERNRALAAEVRDLKKGLAAVEGRARSALGMVGAGETFYRVVEPRTEDAKSSSEAKSAETAPDSAAPGSGAHDEP